MYADGSDQTASTHLRYRQDQKEFTRELMFRAVRYWLNGKFSQRGPWEFSISSMTVRPLKFAIVETHSKFRNKTFVFIKFVRKKLIKFYVFIMLLRYSFCFSFVQLENRK